MNLAEKLPSLMQSYTPTGYPQGQQIDFANVKITCSWSKTLSVTNLMIADLRAVNQETNYSKISQVLDRLSKNWDQRESKYSSLFPLFTVCFGYSFASVHRGDCVAFQRKCDAEGLESRNGHGSNPCFDEIRNEQKVGECAQHSLDGWSIWQDHSLPKVKSGPQQQQQQQLALLRPRQQVSKNFISKRKIS